MHITGIIAEYNPFHLGHLYHIQETKKRTNHAPLVVVMSGNLVQRGELAILDKYLRAQYAIYAGADLVIELPSWYVLQSANFFAKGAIQLLSSIPNLDLLSFGSIQDKTFFLDFLTYETQHHSIIEEQIHRLMNTGLSYPKAYFIALEEKIGSRLDPNDLLGLEYTRILKHHSHAMDFVCIPRIGAPHDSYDEKSTLSGLNIRNMLLHQENIDPWIPDYVRKTIYKNIRSVDYNLLCKLLQYVVFFQNPKSLLHDEPGLMNRFKKNYHPDYFHWINQVVSKRYTRSRIRRFVLSLLLNMKNHMISTSPVIPIIPLAMNGTGSKILKTIPKNFPVITKGKALKMHEGNNPLLAFNIKADKMCLYLINSFFPNDIYKQFPIKLEI